jgi:uncharacterized protein with ParB-like and HNH nuclease domain
MATSFDSHPRNIGNLLGPYEPRKILVPQFQRGFSWEKNHLATFWDDIVGFRETSSTGDTYFLGPIVMLPSKEHLLLLDGQQRLATATITLAVLRDAARKIGNAHGIQEGHDLARDIQRDLIEKKEKDHYALGLGEIDRTFFLKTIQKTPAEYETPRLRSHNLIKNARDFLATSVEERVKNKNPQEAVEELRALRELLTTSITMVSIEVHSEDDAYSIFETLNDRGLRLSVPDLLLNYLMSKAKSDAEKRQIREKWDLMLEKMGRRDIDAFLRHMWLSMYGDLKARGLFREIKEKLKLDKIKSTQFAEESSNECESYVHLLELDEKVLGKSRTNVAGLVKYLSISSSLPLLLSGLRCLSSSDFAKLSRSALDLAIRHSIFANLNPSNLENCFYSAARAIRDGAKKKLPSKKRLSHAREVLAKQNPTDDQVALGAESLILGRSQAQFLITAIANEMQSATKEIAIGDANLEHIFPLNPSTGWKNVTELEPYKWHLGNLTVLSTKLNKDAANADFATKQTLYAKSEIKITRDLLGVPTWDKAALLDRARQLSKLANKVWKGP